MIPKTEPVQVLIADNQFLITESLKYILLSDGRYNVTNVVSEKSELLNALKSNHISVLIIDHCLFDITGISELKEIKTIFPGLRILILTNGLNKGELHELNNNGIMNIILKTAGKEELFEALSSVMKGKKFYSNDLLDLLFDIPEKKILSDPLIQLTNSELEIVRLISEGHTTKEIASQKFISFHTVISHRKNIFRKLGVTSVSELIMYSIKVGWINTIEYYI